MRYFSFILLLFVLNSLTIFSQERESQEIQVVEYQISDINEREEITNEIISNSNKELAAYRASRVESIDKPVDSVFNILSEYQPEYLSGVSAQKLKNISSSIEGINKTVKNAESFFLDKIKQLQNIEEKLKEEDEYWSSVLDYLQSTEDVTKSLVNRASTTKEELTGLKSEVVELINHELDIIGQIASVNAELTKVKGYIGTQEENLRNSYLVRDSEVLWKVHKVQKDTTISQVTSSQIISENYDALRLYFKYNQKILITHLVFILALFLLFLYTQNLSDKIFSTQTTKKLNHFSQKPFISAYVYSFLIVSAFGVAYPVILVEIFLLTLLYPIYQLLKVFIKPANRKFVLIFIFLFALQLFFNQISYVYISGRIALLVLEICIFSYLYFLILFIRKTKDGQSVKFIQSGFIIAAVLFFASALANVLGIVKLSLLLSVSTINVIGIGILIFLFYQISKAILIVLAEIKPFSELNIIKTRKAGFLLRLFSIVRVLLIIMFIRALLVQYKLLVPFVSTWQEFVTKSWKIGEVSISISDFLSFFVIVFITVFAARFLRYLLGGEILPRFIRRRGVPNAISTSVFYIIMVTGLFVAAFSTGIEWNKVNLALGALGVGIGFGLQGLVYNFIAGLILTYERPVQVGDIVQLNTLMGSIKEIGVRSSRVQTYDGAEVVVPNGNLISNEVINWTLSNNHKRQELKFKASTNADPQEIVEILKTIPLQNPKVIQDPSPLALFEGYSDEGTLDFRLLFWTHVDVGLSSKSEVGLAIYKELQKRGYEIPVQKSTIRIENNNSDKPSNGF